MRMRSGLCGAFAAFLLMGVAAGHADAADPAKGKKLFNKCKACHSLEAGKKKIGPSLAGIIGREAGTVDGFKYSKAMKESGVTWTVENIDAYLTKPKEFMPGNKMVFAGLKKEAQRQDLIAYLMEAAQ